MLRTSVCIALFASLAGAQQQPEAPSPWKYIHPSAVVIGGVEWQKASQSPFVRELKRELGSALKVTTKGDPAVMDGLEAIYFSAADVPDGKNMKDTSGLALVRMRKNLDPLLQTVLQGKTRRQNYNGMTVLIPEGDKSGDWRIALLDSRHALMGDWVSLRTAINRTSPPAETPLVTRAKQLAATSDLWLVVNDIGESAAKQNPMLADIRGIDAAISLGARAELTVQLATEAPEKATALATALQLLSTAAPTRPKSLSITPSESLVRITASTTAAEISTAAATLGERFKNSMQPSVPTATGTVARVEPVRPPEKQVIRIHGLDEGVREIPLTR